MKLEHLMYIALVLIFLAAVIICITPAIADNLDDDNVYRTYDAGTLYKLTDAYVYIPTHTDTNTRYLIHYAGGNGAAILRVDLVDEYITTYQPANILIFYKGSGIDMMPHTQERAHDLIDKAQDKTGVIPNHIVITGSSNGGYTTFRVAAYLYSNYGITTDKILIFDMGCNWGLTVLHPSEAETKALLEQKTIVYAFEQHDELVTYFGYKQFAKTKIPVIEVICKNDGHDAITSYAFRLGVMSWALGEIRSLPEDEYTIDFDVPI